MAAVFFHSTDFKGFPTRYSGWKRAKKERLHYKFFINSLWPSISHLQQIFPHQFLISPINIMDLAMDFKKNHGKKGEIHGKKLL